MSRHAKTEHLIQRAAEVLAEHNPMTVRQVYYQLVSRQVIENSRSAYQSVSKALVAARREELIPWEWIEDRLRKPHHVAMWQGPQAFVQAVQQAYRRYVWDTQHYLLELWLEKDALAGIFLDALEPYGVTLNVGRGFDGWSSIKEAANRFGSGKDVVVLYFGDFDPSGEDMVRSLGERLNDLGSRPEIIKVALTRRDIDDHGLPPDFTKSTDTRSAAFVAKHGDISVELDALPLQVLRDRIVREVEKRMDLKALTKVRAREERERAAIVAALESIGEGPE